jgi:mRNA interferase MazF
MEVKSEVLRGDIFFANLGDTFGSEQSGTRPVLIIQNNIGNRWSPTVIVACVTSKTGKTEIPTHVRLGENLILCEQIRTIDKDRLMNKVTTVSPMEMERVSRSLRISLGL